MPDSKRTSLWNRALTVPGMELQQPIEPSAIDGQLPDSLRGVSLLWNGPSLLAFGSRHAHPFDGHGYLRRFDVSREGQVSFTTRFVDTVAYRAERAANRLVHRGLATLPNDPDEGDGASKNRDAPPVKNVANTTLTAFGGKLLAGWEGGPPHAIDPESLATVGLERFGVLDELEAFLAHTRLDRRRDVMVGLSPHPGRTTQLRFRELGPDLVERVRVDVSLSEAAFVHDFVITDRYYVLALNPLSVNLLSYFAMTRGTATLMDMLSTAPERANTVVVVKRPPASARGVVEEAPIMVSTPAPIFAVHYAQAFDDAERIVLDVCAFERFTLGQEFGFTGQTTPFDPTLPDERTPQRLIRLSIDPSKKQASAKQLSRYGIDFPRVHPDLDGVSAPAMVAATRADPSHSDPFDSVITLDLHDLERPEQLWTAPADCFVGEPLFIPTPGGRPFEGAIATLVSDPANERTRLTLFDAEQIAKGPVASLAVPLQPYAFHGLALRR